MASKQIDAVQAACTPSHPHPRALARVLRVRLEGTTFQQRARLFDLAAVAAAAPLAAASSAGTPQHLPYRAPGAASAPQPYRDTRRPEERADLRRRRPASSRGVGSASRGF